MTATHHWIGAIALVVVSFSIPVHGHEIQAPGIPNFHQVDSHIYRGAQPSTEGWNSLARLGVTTVLDLRYEGEVKEHWIATEQRDVEAAGMRYVSVPMDGWSAPSQQQISKILAVLDSGQPVFVHCRGGRDRTGTAIACYRIWHDRWENEKALAEAASYGMNPLETAMQQYILTFKTTADPKLPVLPAALLHQ